MFSILIPSFNNLEYLKICINSLKKNSEYDHQLIVHINEGTDGSLEYVKENKLEYTYSFAHSLVLQIAHRVHSHGCKTRFVAEAASRCAKAIPGSKTTWAPIQAVCSIGN